MRMSARGAVHVGAKARKLQNFGKAWKVGDKGIVLYPIYFDEETKQMELLVAAEWGYQVSDMKALGLTATFIPSNAEIGDDGTPVVPDVTSQFARLAPAFIAGEKEARIKALDAKPWPTPSAHKQALEALEREYDTKNNMMAKKPIISRLKLFISTECIYIPMIDDKPRWENARLYAQSLSNDRIEKLYNIMNDSKYGITPESKFLEVQYDFVAADNEKSTAGKCQPVGQTDQFKLATRFPEDINTFNSLVAQLPEDSDIIRNHNYSYKRFEEAKLKAAFANYAMLNSECLDTIPQDQEELVLKSATLIRDLSLCQALANEELKQKIIDAAAEEDKKAAEAPANNTTSTPTASTGAPTIADLMSNPNRADDIDANDLNDVDLNS